ncbi:MAG: hypothetical protein QW767_02465 [Thermoprotei archaeon]
MRLAYVRYADPKPFTERPGEQLTLESHRVVFQAAGIVIKEDGEYLVLGEVADIGDNRSLAEKYGADMFPSYRNVVPIRKVDILELREVELEEKTAGREHSEETGLR